MAKILFLTYATATGKGGHVYSLWHLSDFIAEDNEVKVMNLGDGDSCILRNSKYFIGSCDVTSWKKVFSLNKQFEKCLNNFKPDIVHCFDEYAYLLALNCSIFKKAKLAYTKCGGPSSPHKVWFHADNIVLFSKENHQWYENKKMYQKSQIKLIPNRVKKVELNSDLIKGLTKKEDEFVFVRIGRIGPNYFNLIISLIDLVAELKRSIQIKETLKILIVGVIEDQGLYEKVKSHIANNNINVEFVTDERAVNGAQFLALADCALGTGRNLMEAMSLNIPVLAPVKNNKFPVLVDRQNFEMLLSTNFSPRNNIDDVNEKEELSKIINIISDRESYVVQQQVVNVLFQQRLFLGNTRKVYSEFYQNTLKAKRTYHVINFLYLVKYLFQNVK